MDHVYFIQVATHVLEYVDELTPEPARATESGSGNDDGIGLQVRTRFTLQTYLFSSSHLFSSFLLVEMCHVRHGWDG